MISRRDKLLNRPWELQRYENHRKKVINAKAAIDVRTPRIYPHVISKPKKVQAEKDRLQKIERENARLLQKLGSIMSSKRMENFWLQPRPNFLNREKLFEVPRPKTCKPDWKSMEKPVSSEGVSPTSGSRKRCPSCSGRPVERIQVIPEQRVPWEGTRKSWNVRNIEDYATKVCRHCQKII